MDLKDFVSETLTQITEGVMDAQEKCKKMGGLVNPMLKVSTHSGATYQHKDSDYPATEVYFKVGLTELNNKGAKTGIGVFLGKVSLGKEANKELEIQSVTSVEFSVTVVFPYINRKGACVNVNEIFSH